MLSKNGFIDAVKKIIVNFLPEEVRDNVEVDDVVVVKMNDQKMHGLVIKEKGSDAGPTFYVDDMYERYSQGEDMTSLMKELAEQYKYSMDVPQPPKIDFIWDNMRDKLTLRLLEKNRNREFLQEMPYVSVGNGLAMTVDINMGDDHDGGWRAAVNYSIMEQMGIDKEQLFTEAIANAPVYDPAILMDMSSALFSPENVNLLDRDEPIAPEDVGGMYVLGNSSGSLGASVLFYPDVKEKAAEVLGSGYYVLPSSIHETILVPDSAGIDEKDLCEMVKQANRAVVEPKDILSDHVYHYSRDDRRLEKVSAEPARDSIVAEAR